MSIEGDENTRAASPEHEKRGAVLVALEVAGARALDGEELRQWMGMVERVLGRPESLSALTEAAGEATAPLIPPSVRAAILWAGMAVMAYNFMVRDMLILLFKLENTPPPAITPDSMLQLLGGLFGF